MVGAERGPAPPIRWTPGKIAAVGIFMAILCTAVALAFGAMTDAVLPGGFAWAAGGAGLLFLVLAAIGGGSVAFFAILNRRRRE